jgi:hypothetical protein
VRAAGRGWATFRLPRVRYAYVLNNPLSATDPLGLYCNWGDGTWDDLDGGADQSDCENQGGIG